MRFASVFSGIESASVAWSPLGWSPAFFAEIDRFPCEVLRHHYGANLPGEPLARNGVPNLGDITLYREWGDEHLADIDVLVGGSPCQAFSIAGLRDGLADPRGNLALVYLGLVDRARPTWVVWENVPGVLSSNDGRDFGAILGALGQLGYRWAYRVLDAQYVRVDGFGRAVPQRRRRVFVVGYSGSEPGPEAVLFDAACLRRDFAPRREARQSVAAPLARGSERGGGYRNDADPAENLIVGPTAATLTRGAESAGRGGYAGRRQEDDENLVILRAAEVAPTLDASYGDKWGLDDQHINGGGGLFVLAAGRAVPQRGRDGPDGRGERDVHPDPHDAPWRRLR